MGSEGWGHETKPENLNEFYQNLNYREVCQGQIATLVLNPVPC